MLDVGTKDGVDEMLSDVQIDVQNLPCVLFASRLSLLSSGLALRAHNGVDN